MRQKAVLILGPTASGKSQLALKLALNTSLPIVNFDSVQVYKGLKIGSAQPSSEDLKLAPHYLYAYVDRGRKYTAADYLDDVKTLLVQHPNKNWIFCGGSGFYLQALEKGMYPVAPVTTKTKAKVEELIQQKGWVEAHKHMLSLDESLSTIHLNDHYRVRRALEILLSTDENRRSLNENLQGSPLSTMDIKKVGIFANKYDLRKRVSIRAKQMLEAGFIEEVEALLDGGYEEWPALSSVGYLQVREFLAGKVLKKDLEEKIVTANMQLIKKQMTWFKRDKDVVWYEIKQLESAVSDLLSWLKSS